MIQNSDLQFLAPKNYLLSPGIETGRQGWGLFNTTLTSKIPTGGITSGAASITTFAPTTTNPLSGDYSLRVASSGAITAGHGFISDAFTIDRKDRAKVVAFSFSYEPISGTMDFSGTSANTWAVYIYDVSGSAWIQPAGVYNMIQASGVGIGSGTFQTTATGTQYRIALICITTTSGPVEIVFDDFNVGPQKTLQGPSGPVGEIIATGSVTPPYGFLYCNGQSVSVSQYQDLFNSIGYTYGGSGASFNVPDLRGVFLRGAGSQTIGAETYSATLGTKQNDATAKNGLSITDPGHFHGGWQVDVLAGGIGANRTTLIHPITGTREPTTTVSTGITLNAGDTETRPANVAVAYHIRYLATYQMSQDTDTRVVAAHTYLNTTQVVGIGGNAIIGSVANTWGTSTSYGYFDTHSGINFSTGQYLVSISGIYEITGYLATGAAASASNTVFLNLHKNGTSISRLIGMDTSSLQYSGSTVIPLNAGDLIDIRLSNGSGSAVTIYGAAADAGSTHWSIRRLSGPATIAASEKIYADYRLTVTQSIPDNTETVVNLNDKIVDSHAAVATGAAWKFIAPRADWYDVNATLIYSSSTNLAAADIYLKKNGSLYRTIGTGIGVPGQYLQGSISVYLNAGEYIQLSTLQDDSLSAARNIYNGANGYTYTCIQISSQ